MKHAIHNLFILDASGSMESIKHLTISAFNEIVQTAIGTEAQYTEQVHSVSLVAFNTLETRTLLWQQPVKEAAQLSEAAYLPNGGTPLYDAMGYAIQKLKGELYNTGPHNVLVTVFTDGEENSSKEFSATAIRSLIAELEGKGWTFTYIGTGHDIGKTTDSMQMKSSNAQSFRGDAAGFKEMMTKETTARQRYASKIQLKEDTKEDFYKED